MSNSATHMEDDQQPRKVRDISETADELSLDKMYHEESQEAKHRPRKVRDISKTADELGLSVARMEFKDPKDAEHQRMKDTVLFFLSVLAAMGLGIYCVFILTSSSPPQEAREFAQTSLKSLLAGGAGFLLGRNER